MSNRAQFIVGILGSITAMCSVFSPLPTFFSIYKKKSTEDYSSVPYIAALLNCLLWLFYGSPLVKMELLVISINAAGALVEIGYLSLFFVYAKDGRKLRHTLVMLLGAVLLFALVVVVSILAIHDRHKREVIVGILCVISKTAMYISPLTMMKTVICTKSTEYMPLPMSVSNLLNGVVWTAYGLIGRNLFFTIPNALGVVSAFGQLILYACYCGTPREEVEGVRPVAAASMDKLLLPLDPSRHSHIEILLPTDV